MSKTTKRLNESENMDKASLILAARSILTNLQDMAEKVAKVEAESIMPLLDGIRVHFGEDSALAFSEESTEALRATLEAIKDTKDHIGRHIDNMESIMNGDGPITDMSRDVGVDDDEDEEFDLEDDDTDLDLSDDGEDEGDDTELDDGDIDDIFGSEPPTGRTAKESYQQMAINILRESKNPDGFIFKETIKRVKNGMSLKESIVDTAKTYCVDVRDVVEITKEHTKK